MPPHSLNWQHTQDGLVLRLGHRADPVPRLISDGLIGLDGVGTSADPAVDLLRLEGQLRREVAALLRSVERADQVVATVRARHHGSRWARLLRPGGRRRVEIALAKASARHTDTVDELEETRAVLEVLRQFVIDLRPPSGLLAEAAAGWQRSAEVPATAVVFDDEQSFQDADPRRVSAPSRWGLPFIDGESFGGGWRRDGDDDDLDVLDRAGPWQVGYIRRTQEIYATRRCCRSKCGCSAAGTTRSAPGWCWMGWCLGCGNPTPSSWSPRSCTRPQRAGAAELCTRQ